MAKKSKGFNDLLKQSRRHQLSSKATNQLEKKIRQGPLGEYFESFVASPAGEAKMSDVLEAFAEPYAEPDMSLFERQSMLGVAVVAWNLANTPLEKRQAMKAEFTRLGPAEDPAMRQELSELLDEMVVRKEKFFAKNKRYIVDYKLEDQGDDWHLSVASTLPR